MQNKVLTKMRFSEPRGMVKARGPDTTAGSKRRRQANALLREIERIKASC